MFFILFSVNVVMMLIMVRKVTPIFVQLCYPLIGYGQNNLAKMPSLFRCSLTEISLAIFLLAEVKTIQPMPDSNSLIEQHLLLASTFQPMSQQQNLLSSHLMQPKIQPMPGSKIILHYNRYSHCRQPRLQYSLTVASSHQMQLKYKYNCVLRRAGDEFESSVKYKYFSTQCMLLKWTNSLIFFMRNTCMPVW